MRNDELFSPGCPVEHAQNLVLNYALRGLLDGRKCYEPGELLNRQYKVYLEWLAELRASNSDFSCGFYEWMARQADSAFVFRPGDLVKYNGRYCVVVARLTRNISWINEWRIVDGKLCREDWPQRVTTLDVKEADGSIHCVNGLDDGLEPADIPPEVFALACGKAKDCPMLKGERNG